MATDFEIPIPTDKNGKLRSAEMRGLYAGGHSKMKILESISSSTDTLDKLQETTRVPDVVKTQTTCTNRKFTSLIPKMNLNIEKVEQNPRILDLREKLNEITKNQNRGVDKKTKSLLNDITQLVDEKEVDESGPYSLLFDLQNDPSTSSVEKVCRSEGCEEINPQNNRTSTSSLDRLADRLPNVLNFDEKHMREFEYSCENDVNFPVKKTFGTHSRSDLCLQLKSNVHARPLEINISPNDNSTSRTNEENSLDDSLGILTPDQMDDICYLDNTFSPTVEGLPIFCDNNESKCSPDNGDTPSTDKTESNSAASAIQNDGFDDRIKTCESYCSIKVNAPTEVNSSASSVFNERLYEPELVSDVLVTHNIHAQNDNTTIHREELLPSLIEEEFMPSIHSSILEPTSSVHETTVNLEIPLDCKHDNRVVINRIEQTPSPEDLPLDHSDINGEISTYSQFSGSTLHDSQTYSDSKHDYPKSMETSKVSNSFITSITSITSLDGYQGDGEMSRPVSRGADHSIGAREDVIEMDWQNVPVTRRADPMTDSDFFTESDADGLDDNMQRGDRKAQVIDGALYGGKNGNGNPPLIVNRNDDSCMESSGVYTDFENHRSSPVFLNVIDDMSPEGATPSSRSECSQKNCSTEKLEAYYAPVNNNLVDQKSDILVDDGSSKNTSKRNSVNSEKDLRTNEKVKEEKRFTLKKYKMPKRDVPSKLKSMLANRKTDADNSTQCSPKVVKKTERRENFVKKNSLDLKGEYKTKSFKDIKSKVDCSFSLQRSQTACSVSRMLSSKSPNTSTKPKSRHMRMRIELNSANGSGKSSLHSSQSDISASGTPHGKHPSTRISLLRNGKKRDSTPVPTPARPPPAPATPVQQPPTQAKKNGVVQKLSASPVSVRSRTSLAPPPSPRKPTLRVPAQRPNTLPTNNTSKEPPRVSPAVGPRGKRAQTPQQTRTPPAPLPASLPAPITAPLAVVPREQTAALAHAAKGVEALGVLVQYLVFQLDALNSSSWKVEAERWRSLAAAERNNTATAQKRAQKDLDTITECVSKISELEKELSYKEEATARLQATHLEDVTILANDIKGLKATIESLKHEVTESRARLHAHSEIERTLRAQLDAARAEIEHARLLRATETANVCEKSCDMCDAACDPVCCEAEDYQLRISVNEELSSDANELAAEVRSLRAVVEMKQAEIASLRDARSELGTERERRVVAERDTCAARHAAEELKERAAARQREVDRLKDDNRRLRETAARDRDHATRLVALNEELRYKLRQRSQVMSILTGSTGYMERSCPRARTSSGDSGRSASPAPDSPPSPAASPDPDSPPLPAVKAVVEKHDSVSWVLEIEESPEEVASRLARKSSFRTGASPSGVKRRGGGSPGSASPAPASPAPNASKLFRPGELDFPHNPPPLKESAGEAIYIYDDRQY